MRRSVGLCLVGAGILLCDAMSVAFAQEHPGGPAIDEPVASPGQDAGTGDGQEEAAKEETSASRIEPALQAIEAAIRELVAEDDAEERKRQEKREEADLQAQEDMVLWAGRMTYATWAGVVLTLIGLALIARTMLYTRDAALYAKTAAEAGVASVEEAKKSTSAAVKSADAAMLANVLQRELFITANRPWLCIEEISPTGPLTWDGGTTLRFRLYLQNYGHAVATDGYIQTILELDARAAMQATAQRLQQDASARHYIPAGIGFNVIPGKPYIYRIAHTLTRETIEAALEGARRALSLAFIGHVGYSYQAARVRFGFTFNFRIYHVDTAGKRLAIGPDHGNVATERLQLVPFPSSHTIFGG